MRTIYSLLFLLVLTFSNNIHANVSLSISPYHYLEMQKNENLTGIIGAGVVYQINKSQFNVTYNFTGSILGHGAFATYDSVVNLNVISFIYKYRPEIKSIGPLCHNYGIILSTRFEKRMFYNYKTDEYGDKLQFTKEVQNIKKDRHNFLGAYFGIEANVKIGTIELSYAPGLINMNPSLNNYHITLFINLF